MSRFKGSHGGDGGVTLGGGCFVVLAGITHRARRDMVLATASAHRAGQGIALVVHSPIARDFHNSSYLSSLQNLRQLCASRTVRNYPIMVFSRILVLNQLQNVGNCRATYPTEILDHGDLRALDLILASLTAKLENGFHCLIHTGCTANIATRL